MITHSISLFASHFSQNSLFLGKFFLVYFIIHLAVTNSMLAQRQIALTKHAVLSFCYLTMLTIAKIKESWWLQEY
jgi:uncharacterized membrane protein